MTDPLPLFLQFAGRRPFTLNWERTKHQHTVAKEKKIWREEFARQVQGEERMSAAIIVAQVHLRDHYHQDVGSAFPTVKAAIDGLVDGGLLTDDDPRYVRGLLFLPPVCGSFDGLDLYLYEAEEAQCNAVSTRSRRISERSNSGSSSENAAGQPL